MSRFQYVNNNPKGKDTSDCVIRAFVTALALDAKIIMYELTECYMTTGYFINEPRCYNKYLKRKGYVKCKQLRKPDRKKYTAEEFCVYLDNSTIQGPVVAHVGIGHISVFVNNGTPTSKNYQLNDTWDCTDKCVGNYWIQATTK